MHSVRRILCIAVLGLLAAWLAWWSSVPLAERAATIRVNQSTGAVQGDGDRGVERPAPLESPAVQSPAPVNDSAPPARFAFDSLIAGREPIKTEARMFQAQKWEPDIAKNLDLPPGTPLQRRSAWFRIPELKFPLVRVDRIYRMDRGKGGATGLIAPPNRIASGPVAPPEKIASGLLAPPSAPEGELLWDNAMIADHLMVQAQPGISREQLQRALPAPCRIQSAVNAEKGLYLVSVPHAGDGALERAMLALNHESLKRAIQFAEPDFLMSGADTTPDDPLFTASSTDTTKQWALPKIMAPRAWDVIKQPGTTTIANTTVVAVVDTGVDYTHPDLAANLYVNPGESGGSKESNGTDDDGNGKVDDYRGWNFVEDNNDPMDDVGHGTHVAGIIGAAGNNNLGVTGACWGVKLLPLRIIKKLGLGTYGVYSDAVAAMDYMRALNSPSKRVAVANHSWGGSGYSLAMLNAVNNPLLTADPLPDGLRGTYEDDTNILTVTGTATELNKIKIGMQIGGVSIPEGTLVTIISGSASSGTLSLTLSNYSKQRVTNQPVCFANPVRPKPYGIVHVAAAGNSRFNADRIPTYPASLPSGFIISVAASDTSDAASIWSGGAGSNYGRLNVDLFAPGSGIWSTKLKLAEDPSYGYESRNGTSMAAPFVTGSVALLKMWQPRLTDMQARQVIIENADVLPSLKDKCVSGGRLNLARVVDKLYQPMLVGSGGSTSGSGAAAQVLSDSMALVGRIVANPVSSSVFFLDRGELWSWGANTRGELGNGTSTPSAVPTRVIGMTDVVMAAAMQAAAFALRSDGTVWAWGWKSDGRLGNGVVSGGVQLAPVQIPGLSDIVWISAGGSHAFAVREDGKVFGWGINTHGIVGDGTTTTRYAPVELPGLSNFIQVEAGLEHSMAVCADGSVYGWGARSTFGNRLGDGASTEPSLVPVLIPQIQDVVFVDSTWESTLFLKSDGTVWRTGRLGGVSRVPEQVPFPGPVRALSGGYVHAIALDEDGELYAWGENGFGAFGNGSIGISLATPDRVPMDYPVITCAAGFQTSFTLDSDSVLRSTGQNSNGNLGITNFSDRAFAVPHSQLSELGILRFGGAGGTRWACDSQGDVYVWGATGLAGLQQRPTRLSFFFPSEVMEVSTEGRGWFFAARLADGTVWSWGANSTQATQVAGISQAAGLVCGSGFTLVTRTDGTVWSWGANDYGQLGNGTTGSVNSVPAQLPVLNSVVQIAASYAHAAALRADGTVWTWGFNGNGQLGDSTGITRPLPQPVPGVSGVIQIACSGSSTFRQATFALTAGGALYGWGAAGGYFSPAGVSGDQHAPVIMYQSANPAEKIVKFACLSDSIVAILANGNVTAWGGNAGELLGDYPRQGGSSPRLVFGATHAVDIIAGGPVAFIKRQDGSISCWGSDNGSGTMGLGDSWSTTFVEVVGFGELSTTLSDLGTGDTADSWLFQSFSVSEILDGALLADSADPDQDGIPNLLEYALGLDPRAQDLSGLPTLRLDEMQGQSTSQDRAGAKIMLFSVNDCCIGTPVGLDPGKHYLAFTVERREGTRTDIEYIIEMSTDLTSWRRSQADVLTVINTGELLEAYSTAAIEDEPRQFMRLKVRRK